MKKKLNTATIEMNPAKVRALYYAIIEADSVYAVKNGVNVKVKLKVHPTTAQYIGKYDDENGTIDFIWWDQGIFENVVSVLPRGFNSAKKVGDKIELIEEKGKKFEILICKDNPTPIDIKWDFE